MNSLWPSRASQETPAPASPTEDAVDTEEVADMGPGAEQLDQLHQRPVPMPPPRPGLPRTVLQPGPQAPDPAQGRGKQQPPAPADSLTLLQLRRMVAEANRVEPAAYDFTYADMGPHTDEIDEWFVYQFWQWVRLNAAQKAFEWHWSQETGGHCAWEDADPNTRATFVEAAVGGVLSCDAATRSASAAKLVYLVLGRWGDTAMPNAAAGESKPLASAAQLQAIKEGVECLASLEGLPVVWEALRNCFELHWSGDMQQRVCPQEAHDELMNLMTIVYIAIQETLNDPDHMSDVHQKLRMCQAPPLELIAAVFGANSLDGVVELNPSLVDFMVTTTSRLRWDEQNTMPHTQIFLLFWKSILLDFGGSKELKSLKTATSEMNTDGKDREVITASPLDYHVFRQEITSKYPAYIPPQPLIALEAENTSLLPPLPNLSSRSNAANGILPTPAHAQNGGASILHQPVHIATPAPSPPPSPGIGGKGGKKQNYQTNQNFPFMYPPLDATSNSAGGKGMAGIHDALVCRRWESSDIPASILEAGELFSSRVRMTRATRQLWEERERFLKYDRGWAMEDEEDEVDSLDLDELTLEEKQILQDLKAEDKRESSSSPPEAEVDFGPRPDRLSDRDKQRLVAVERFYREALPHLQSLVIVLLRPILVNVTSIVTQQAAQMPNVVTGRGNNPGVNGGSAVKRHPDMVGQMPQPEPELSPEEVDAARTREITAKAMTAILLLLLKWLRVSHVLKFEYLTQLLLDSNYVPLVLKLFAHQDIQHTVDSKMDRLENSFFQFCNLRSKFNSKTQTDAKDDGEEGTREAEEKREGDEKGGADESNDSAAPPPVKRRRSPEQPGREDEEEVDGDGASDDQAWARPEVDELGYPVNPLPAEPITDFSKRNFFSLINYLRVMQKICKNKAHRNLLLVQYKSSTILRKSLRVPQDELRLYTLKLFKNQVPYCGRKWRQSNMRVITSVYLHCRPELRDEWLAGSDVDAEVEGALPLEQALRSLTHWRNVRRYPDKIAADIRTAMREEQDFFTRELEKLDVNWADMGGDDGIGEMDHVGGWA